MNEKAVRTELREAFHSASSTRGLVSVDGAIAGRGLRFQFADPVLQTVLMPSLLGLREPQWRQPSGEPFTIMVWSGSDGRVPCAHLVSYLAQHQDKVSVVNRGSFHLLYNPEGGILSCIDTMENEAYYFVACPEQLPDYEICTPMRMLFNWFSTIQGSLMVHAAAVGVEGRGALIIGKSGAGKSTTGLQCLLHGMEYLGDDYVVVEGAHPPKAHHLYRGCKVMDDALERLPRLKPYVMARNQEAKKNVVMLDENIGRLAHSLDIAAIVRPRVCQAPATTFSRLSPVSAVTEFAGSTILQMPGTGGFMLRELSHLCSSVPVYDMFLGRDPGEISESLSLLLVHSGG